MACGITPALPWRSLSPGILPDSLVQGAVRLARLERLVDTLPSASAAVRLLHAQPAQRTPGRKAADRPGVTRHPVAGIQATILRFNAAMDRIPPAEPGRRLMEEALNGADSVMAESRDWVRNLRVREEILNSLPEAFRLAGKQLFGEN